MKKILLAILVLFSLSAVAWAQMGPDMMRGSDQSAPAWGPGMRGGGHGLGPGYGGCYGGGPGYGMMGYGSGYGMMGGYGMGYGMGPGMGYGVMGFGQWMSHDMSPEMKKFLDETRDLRKKLHMLRFDYMEALRNPDTKAETLRKLQKEIRELTIKLYEKMPFYEYEKDN